MALKRSAIAVVLLALLGAACRAGGPGARSAEMRSFREVGVGAAADPTVKPARLVPESADDTVGFGAEAGGGTRVITAGLRVVTSRKGAILAAEERFSSPPLSTVALPERLGGGFLFVIGTTLWRADRWLGPVKPIFTAPFAIQAIVPGLDRVYARSQNAALAIDGVTGQVLDLGPWPASPTVASYAAADGWRAAAVTDLRGVVATFDAGATWRSLDLGLDPRQVVVASDSLAIGGFENGRTEAWYELRADGSVARLGGAPREAKRLDAPPPPTTRTILGGAAIPGGISIHVPSAPPTVAPTARPAPTSDGDGRSAEGASEDFAVRTFGKRPLATAIEDGWPLTDGTAVVARDGSLARVRLSDGVLTEVVRDAFPLKPARCHPMSLTRPNATGAFGFVCGEPRGATVIYAYEPMRGRLQEIKRFDKPRVVSASGNGALAVRGPCAEDGEPPEPPRPELVKVKEEPAERDRSKDKSKDAPAKLDEASPPKQDAALAKPKPELAPPSEPHPYCVFGYDNTWREVHVRGDVGGERVIVMADGRIVVVSPPQGYVSPARITVLDKGHATTVPLVYGSLSSEVARALRLGLWLDGFEERRPGVVGGWIEAGGVMLGLEIALDGHVTTGQFIRDAGVPFVSGRYGLGWTASRRGFETTDGGMTWTSIDVPDPLVPIAKVERRACGPIGCLAHGWLRVGWGEPKRTGATPVPAPYRPTNTLSPPHLQLTCEPLAAAPPAPSPARARPPAAAVAPTARIRIGTFGSSPGVLGQFNGLTDLPPFFSQSAPIYGDAERGLSVEVRELLERFPTVGSLARVYGWGPRSGTDWDTQGRWQVRWLSPFAGWPDIKSSLPSSPPQLILESTRATGYPYFGGSGGISTRSDFQLVPGEDGAHALLLGKRNNRTDATPFELEADRAPVEIRRADGEPFGDIEGVVRASGRWFIATASSSAASALPSLTTTIWQVEGGVARELVRVPRLPAIPIVLTTSRTRLARRSDGRSIGLVVDGQPTVERATPVRWVLPIDLESGALAEPESLGYSDLAGRTLEGCTDDLVGWVFDTALPQTSARLRLPQGGGALNSLHARVRMTTRRACIERIAGSYEGQSAERAAQLTRAGGGARSSPSRPGEIGVSALSAQTRYPLRCSVTK